MGRTASAYSGYQSTIAAATRGWPELVHGSERISATPCTSAIAQDHTAHRRPRHHTRAARFYASDINGRLPTPGNASNAEQAPCWGCCEAVGSPATEFVKSAPFDKNQLEPQLLRMGSLRTCRRWRLGGAASAQSIEVVFEKITNVGDSRMAYSRDH